MIFLKPALTAVTLGAVAVTGVAHAGTGSSSSTSGASSSTAHHARAGDRVPGGGVVRRWYAGLDATQRACLARHDVTTHLGPSTPAQRLAVLQQVRTAAVACDLTPPKVSRQEKRLEFWQGLTADQRACLAKVELSRPIGPMTKEQRQARRQEVRQAASSCGVTLPGRAGSARGAGATHTG